MSCSHLKSLIKPWYPRAGGIHLHLWARLPSVKLEPEDKSHKQNPHSFFIETWPFHFTKCVSTWILSARPQSVLLPESVELFAEAIPTPGYDLVRSHKWNGARSFQDCRRHLWGNPWCFRKFLVVTLTRKVPWINTKSTPHSNTKDIGVLNSFYVK